MYKAKRLNMRIVNNRPQVWLKNKQSIKVIQSDDVVLSTWLLAEHTYDPDCAGSTFGLLLVGITLITRLLNNPCLPKYGHAKAVHYHDYREFKFKSIL